MGGVEFAQLVISLLGSAVSSQGPGDVLNILPAEAGGIPSTQGPNVPVPGQQLPQEASTTPEAAPDTLMGPIQDAKVAGAQTASQAPVVVPPRVTLPQPPGQMGPPQPVGTGQGGATPPAVPPGKPPASLGEILQAIAPALAGNNALFGQQPEGRPTVAPPVGQNAGQAQAARNPQIDIGRLLAALPGVR